MSKFKLPQIGTQPPLFLPPGLYACARFWHNHNWERPFARRLRQNSLFDETSNQLLGYQSLGG